MFKVAALEDHGMDPRIHAVTVTEDCGDPILLTSSA